MRTGDHYIAGEMVAGEGLEIDVENPATEAVIGQVVSASPGQVDDAVAAAADALAGWRRLDLERRVEWLAAIADGLEARSGDLTQSIVAELGSPIRLTEKIHVELPITCVRALCESAAQVEGSWRSGGGRVVREPVGVVVGITP